jgi:hypothetical protein
MSSALIALGAGTVLAVGALAFVLYPIFFGTRTRRRPAAPVASDDLAIVALREIEFDRATGKLSEADYTQLKERYTREALQLMRHEDAAGAAGADDEIEAAIRDYRSRHPSCAVCGPRPETDAAFCSSCGRYLAGACEQCGRRVDEIGARFCAACGHRLAA